MAPKVQAIQYSLERAQRDETIVISIDTIGAVTANIGMKFVHMPAIMKILQMARAFRQYLQYLSN